jgi:poly-gamma-glutamate synthesis protein (capsule biosynthesis protein)
MKKKKQSHQKKLFFILGSVFVLLFLFCLLSVQKYAQIQSARLQKEKIQTPEEKAVTLLFGGDAMFDRYIRTMMRTRNISPLQSIKVLSEKHDATIVNLEGPITGTASVSELSAIGSPKNYIFTFDTSIPKYLKNMNIRVAHLGNNHICNIGKKGLEETKQWLWDSGITYFGQTCEKTAVERVQTPEYNQSNTLILQGKKIGLVSYNAFLDGTENATLSDIEKLSQSADVVIVYTHWGNEYQKTASEVQKRLAHQFIDKGADLIIGSHPHVVQNVEDYKGKRIYYSLGNMVFDQYFSAETMRGLLVSVTISPDNTMTYSEIPIRMKNTGETVVEEQ